MQINVKLFAAARQALDRETIAVELPAGSQIGSLRDALCEQFPELKRIIAHSLFAIGTDYCDDTRELSEESDVSLIPPGQRRLGRVVKLTNDRIDTESLVTEITDPSAGAVVLFLGTTRQFTAGRETESLDYEAHSEMAAQKLKEIEQAACERWPIVRCGIIHRLGHLELKEASVAVAVSTAHRVDAFAAAQWIMDEIKKIVPIWKKENWNDGTSDWVHPGMEMRSDLESDSE